MPSQNRDRRLNRLSSLDSKDVARFDAAAADWWNPDGSMRALHQFNPARIAALTQILTRAFSRDRTRNLPLKGLRLLDIGCGAGLVSEPLARIGAEMTAIDAAPQNVEVARAHAEEGGLNIDYRCLPVEALAETAPPFDAVLMLEVIEHVANRSEFIKNAASLVRPGGVLIAATLNRTLKSYALAIVGAEYILGWVEKGTHDWRQFVTPGELESGLAAEGLRTIERIGFVYDPLKDKWSPSHDLSVNYMIAAKRTEVL